MSDAPTDAPGDEALLRLLGGKWITAALSAAAQLRVPDALVGRPLSLEELATALQCPSESLGRLMRVLAAEDVIHQDVDDKYRLQPMGEALCQTRMGALAAYVGSSFAWAPWGHLSDAVRTNRSAVECATGQTFYEYASTHPDEARVYDRAVDAFTRHEACALASAFDFSDASLVADIGGGRGLLLAELLSKWPHMRGVLLDQSYVLDDAHEVLRNAGVLDRTQIIEGDFFESVPHGADHLILKHVLHNWSDADALRILQACADALPDRGSLLVVEGVLLPGNIKDLTGLLDLEMFALFGAGRERSKQDFRALFRSAGLKLTVTMPLSGSTRLLVTQHA